MSQPWEIVLTLAVGVATGVVSGMFGVGGAVVSTPAIRAIGATPLQAVGSTLPSVFPSAISGSLRYRREGLIARRVALWTGSAGVLATVGGALLTDVIPGGGHPLMILTAALLIFTAVRTGITPKMPALPPADPDAMPFVATEEEPASQAAARSRAGVASTSALRTVAIRDARWRLVTIGATAGLLSGLLGIGGGVLMVPAFTGWVRMGIKQAVATSLVCVGILAVPGTITHAILGNIDWAFAVPLAVGVIPGARLGANLAIRASDVVLRRSVAIVLGLIACVYAVGEILALA